MESTLKGRQQQPATTALFFLGYKVAKNVFPRMVKRRMKGHFQRFQVPTHETGST